MTSLRLSRAVAGCAAIVLIASDHRASAEEIHGVIAAVDAAKNELRVDGRGAVRGESMSFTLDDKTLVLFGSEKASAADLRPGRRVRVEFERLGDGSRLARVIRATGRPPAPPVAKAAPGSPGPPGAKAAPASPAPPGDGISGVLQRVARTDREIVVIGPGPKGPETESTLSVPEGAKVVREGQPSSLDALKEGDAVAVRTEQRDGRLSAVEIQAGPGATLSTAPPPQERGRVIQRLRQALHMADEVLKQMDRQ
jgi:Domain of unknown function (DUF5666)